MRIDSINYTDIKNRNGNLALERIQGIVGANRSGKTTVRDAIFLAMKGEHPELPKTNKGIVQLSATGNLRVQATFEGGDTVTRAWTTNKAGATSATVDFSTPQLQSALTKVTMASLQPDAFFAMKGTERIAFLAELADPEALRAKLLTAAEESGDTEAEDLIADAADPLAAARTMEKRAIDRRKAAKQDFDRVKKALQEALATQASGPGHATELSGGDLALAINEADQAIWQATKDRDAARAKVKEIADALATEQNAAGIGARIAELRNLIETKALTEEEKIAETEYREQERAAASSAEARASLQRSLSEAESHILDSDTRSDLAATVEAFDGDPATAQPEAIEPIEREFTEAEREGFKLEHERRDLQQQIDQFVEESNALLEHETCPTCGTEGADFHASYKELVKTRLADLQRKYDEVDQKERIKKGNVEDLRAALSHTRARNNGLALAQQAQSMLDAEKKAHAQLENIQAALDKTAKPLTGEQRAFLERIEDLERQTIEAKREIERLENQTTGESGLTEKDHDAATAEHKAASEALEKAQLARQDLNAAEAAAKEHQAADAAVERLTAELDRAEETKQTSEAAVATIRQAKTDIIADAWDPITRITDRVLAGIFGASVTTGIDETDIGIRDNDGYRPFDVCSGAERTALVFGLQIALASVDPSAARIAMIDETNRLDPEAYEGFLKTAKALASEGAIDQVIIFDHEAEFLDAADIPVWKAGE